MLVPPGAGLVTTAFAQLCWSGFLWPGGEAFSFSGLLMAAASVTGDPWGTCMSADVLDDDCRLHRLKKVSDTKDRFKGHLNSDLICKVNTYLHCLHLGSAELLETCIVEEQVKMFRFEFVHLARRVIDYVATLPASLHDTGLIRLHDQMVSFGKFDDLQWLPENGNVMLLQVLSGAPCLVCGHELQKSIPSGCTFDSQPKPGMWVHLRNVFKGLDQETQESALHRVAKWLQALGISQPALSVSGNEDRHILWEPKSSEDAGRTIQMLTQWARQNRSEVVTDWMMSWSAVLPRRKARLSRTPCWIAPVIRHVQARAWMCSCSVSLCVSPSRQGEPLSLPRAL